MHKAPLRLRLSLRLRILNYARHQSKPRRNLDQTRPPVHTHQIACCLSAEAKHWEREKKRALAAPPLPIESLAGFQSVFSTPYSNNNF